MFKLSGLALNERYHRLLKEYMEEMQFKDIFGKRLSQARVCQVIIMDALDIYYADKHLVPNLDSIATQDQTHLPNKTE